MGERERGAEATRAINDLLDELWKIVDRARRNEDHEAARERMSRWRLRTGDLLRRAVTPDEGRKFLGRQRLAILTDPFKDLVDAAELYTGFLRALREEIEQHPEMVWGAVSNMGGTVEIAASLDPEIFIIHGHDEFNLLKLQALLRDRWQLQPVILAASAGRGRTLIEKFEQEAQRAVFAFALITPDDPVVRTDDSYAQARPNVLFELGWFFGRLGRDRVCVLFRAGTRLHSDLDGVSRIEFRKSLDEVEGLIERELRAAGILTLRPAP